MNKPLMPELPLDLFAWLDECGALAPFRDNGDDAEDAIKAYAEEVSAAALESVGVAYFTNGGNSEADFIAHHADACPHCGGSGHAGDIASHDMPKTAEGEPLNMGIRSSPAGNLRPVGRPASAPSDQRIAALEARLREVEKDAAMLDWLDSHAFTAYRNRDPDSGAFYGHTTLVNEDAKRSRSGNRRGIVGDTIRECITAALEPRNG